MGILSLFQRKQKNTQAITKNNVSLGRAADSTGTPMDKLHGGAKRMAQMSNIGGGSKATGGGGVYEGMKAMLQYTWANTVKIRRLKPRMWLRSCWSAV